jgi:hypothetical protein
VDQQASVESAAEDAVPHDEATAAAGPSDHEPSAEPSAPDTPDTAVALDESDAVDPSPAR